ncbi:MAG: hypothetical protein ACREM6_13165, partial [Vulcanimicrobiaceae bacterium]
MPGVVDRRRNGEGGFTVLEAAVAAAIVTIAVGGVLGAVLAVARQTSALDERGRLRMVAEDVLTDLRAMTAYDPVELAAVSGRSQAATVELPSAAGGGPPVRVTVRWAV